MPEKVLITGGAGFIGSHLADALIKEGYQVRIIDALCPPVHEGFWPDYVLNKGFELFQGDVTKKEDLEKALAGVSAVYHFAAHQDQLPNYSKFFDTNTTSTALIYEIINEKKLPIKKVVYSSSQFVYGDGFYLDSTGNKFMPSLRSPEQFRKGEWEILDSFGGRAKFIPFTEGQKPNPTNSYGLSKLASENFALTLGKQLGIPTTIVRFSIVQGPRQSPRNIYSGALRIFVTQALSGAPITVYEDGNQTRDFVNVADVTKANVLMLKDAKTNFRIFNIGGGTPHKVLDFAKLVKEITRSQSEIKVDGSFRSTDTRHAVSDVSSLKALGWQPEFTPEKSIQDYSNWIISSKYDVKNIVSGSEEKLKSLGVTTSS